MLIFSCLPSEILQQSQRISENQEHFTEIKSKVNQKEEQKKDLAASIQELKEELMKRKESKQRIRSTFY